MPAVTCPTCQKRLKAPDASAGRTVRCPGCRSPVPVPELLPAVRPAAAGYGAGVVGTAFCPACGNRVHERAELCPACGVRQPGAAPAGGVGFRAVDSVKTPLLVSAIANIVFGLGWAATCVGVVIALPMWTVCVFEFIVWAHADDTPPATLGWRAQLLGVAEVVAGVFNLVSLPCGVINIIKGGQLKHRDRG